jgi:DNA mismatch endonuclease, patch repair protein
MDPVVAPPVSFIGLSPASQNASRAARGSSRKANTRCELVLRRALWHRRLRYRLQGNLPGRPDIIFVRQRVVVFCDGDFWHGRNLEARVARLASGHNAPYWVAKIRTNVERDRLVTSQLREAGWLVIRVWEADILREPDQIAAMIGTVVVGAVTSQD